MTFDWQVRQLHFRNRDTFTSTNDGEETMLYTVTDATDDGIVVDSNHP